MTRNSIATAIHRFVEWKFPGETAADNAKRGIAHYNYAAKIANSSLVITVTTIALTILHCIHPVIGCLFGGLSGFVHYQSACHLNGVNKFLVELVEAFMRQLNPLPSPTDHILAEKMVQHIQPIRLCDSGLVWYGQIPTISSRSKLFSFT
jgi:hypothetical protein